MAIALRTGATTAREGHNCGTLDPSSSPPEVRGDLTNAGTVVPGTSSITFSGTADQVLTPGGAALYQMLVSKPTAGANTLRLAGNLIVDNFLIISIGLITAKAASGTIYTLRLPNGASLSGEASGRYVLGPLQITRNGVSGTPVDLAEMQARLGALLAARRATQALLRRLRSGPTPEQLTQAQVSLLQQQVRGRQ